jgi:hypothetical protein
MTGNAAHPKAVCPDLFICEFWMRESDVKPHFLHESVSNPFKTLQCVTNRSSIECFMIQMAMPLPDGAAEGILCLFGTWAVVVQSHAFFSSSLTFATFSASRKY